MCHKTLQKSSLLAFIHVFLYSVNCSVCIYTDHFSGSVWLYTNACIVLNVDDYMYHELVLRAILVVKDLVYSVLSQESSAVVIVCNNLSLHVRYCGRSLLPPLCLCRRGRGYWVSTLPKVSAALWHQRVTETRKTEAGRVAIRLTEAFKFWL